jgi:metacaspase-1
MTDTFALCVGINQYKDYPSAALQGCVNDAHDMAALLQDLLGFAKGDIQVLTDQQATKAKIMAALRKMVAGAKSGKHRHLVFSLSSHGTQVPDRDGDESDRADEAFCPHDLAQKGSQWDPDHLIVDDELHDLFAQLPQEVLLEVYLDTCHSGTGLKAIDHLLDRKPRYLPPPSLAAFRDMEHRRPREARTKLLEKGLVHHILWAACRSSQTSADAHIDGGWHGAFTYYFCKEARKADPKLTRTRLLKLVQADLLAGHYTQTPQLEGQATARKAALLTGR